MGFLFKIVPAMVFFCILLSFAWYIFLGGCAVKIVGEIKDHGAKSIVERIWEGESKE